MSINRLSENLVGKAFEIECSSIKVHGMLDHHPPLFEGPGTIKAGPSGKISFRMHNQIKETPEALSSLQWFKKDGIGLEPASQVRIFAEDYDGISWTGAWSIPQRHHSSGSQSIIAGSFDQLSTRIPKSKEDTKIDVTELVYGHKLHLPLTKATERLKVQDGQVLAREIWLDRQDIDYKGAKISIVGSDANKRTHITAEKRDKFKPPLIENWVSDAVMFVTARLVYPRLIIRHFEKDALVFLRAYPSDTRSGMPPPISFGNWGDCWELFKLYLAKCEEAQQFESIDLTRVFQEVILASTGTVQAFVLSLALCIENLIGQLSDSLGLEVADEVQLKQLHKYVTQWSGEASIKNRALGLLSMLGTKSISDALKKLQAEDTIQKEHVEAWKKIRPILAHGGIIKDPFDPVFWQSRNLLIDMTYRLVFRLIGYKGVSPNFVSDELQLPDEDKPSDQDSGLQSGSI